MNSERRKSDDNKITFLIMATLESPNRWTRPFFVRAASLADAYSEVIKDPMFQYPSIRLEGHIIDASMIPNVKEVAQDYWSAGRQAEANPNHEATFEEFWEEHGAYPGDDR